MTPAPGAGALRLDLGGLTFPARTWGPAGGEPVLALHGFPQHGGQWAAVGDRLARAGLRVVAPDQRGYAATARPDPGGPGAPAYAMAHLLADALGMLDALGWPRAHVLGHDWGAAVAWQLAARHPGRVRTLTAVSVPHPLALTATLADDAEQRERLSYLLLFRREGAAEALLAAQDGRRLREIFAGSGLAEEVVDGYVGPLLTQPGALSAALSWYRAMGDGSPAPPVAVPTTYVWGERDVAIGRVAAERTAACVDAPYTFVPLAGVGHWVPEEAPDDLAVRVRERVRG